MATERPKEGRGRRRKPWLLCPQKQKLRVRGRGWAGTGLIGIETVVCKILLLHLRARNAPQQSITGAAIALENLLGYQRLLDAGRPLKSQPGPPMTLGNAAAAHVRLIIWCKARHIHRRPDSGAVQLPRVALGFLLKFGHPATRRWGPHPKLESRPNPPLNGFSNGLLGADIDYGMLVKAVRRRDRAFSKKVDNHCHALALHFVFYNFVRIHKTLRVTPAMAAGVSDRPWSMHDIVALMDATEGEPKKRGPCKPRQAAQISK